MNRPSPDDMKEIMMAELREENKKLEEENEKMKKHIRENGYIDDVAYIKKENARLKEENKKLKEDVEYFRQIYLDLKKMCEDDGYLLTDEEVTKLFNLDEIK